MEIDEKSAIEQKKIRDLQASFDKSMKILESHIAESITNKEKLDSIKRDLKEANEKFLEAERCLEDLKIEVKCYVYGTPFADTNRFSLLDHVSRVSTPEVHLKVHDFH